MMKQEFEKLAGYEVSDWDYYHIIEPMYTNVYLDKEEFIKTLNKKRFALPTSREIVKKLKAKTKLYVETLPTDWNRAFEIKGEIEQMGREFASKYYHWGADPHNEWLYLDVRRDSWTNEVQSIILHFGTCGSLNKEIILFAK